MAIAARNEHISLQGYFSCNKIKQNIYFIATIYFIADVRKCAVNAAVYFIAAFSLVYCT